MTGRDDWSEPYQKITRYADLTDEQKARVELPLYWKRVVYENGKPKRDDSGWLVTETVPVTIDGMTDQEIADAQARWINRAKVKP